MSKKIRAQDIMLLPIQPIAKTVEEVARTFVSTAITKDTSESSNGVWDSIERVVSAGSEVIADTIDWGAEQLNSGLDAMKEFADQEPHLRLIQLYRSLGVTDAFLQAVYEDPELIAATNDIVSSDIQIGFLASPQISVGMAHQYSSKFDMDTIISSLSVGSSMPLVTRKGLFRILEAHISK